MSGPVTSADAPDVDTSEPAAPPATVELLPSREAQVGRLQVRRALPRRARRTVGAWCFADHMGPAPADGEGGFGIGPHPHIGLQTVTWFVSGEGLHRDSLGSEQVVRAGELNLMTAGRGVAHAEEPTGGFHGDVHGVQLWVAQPSATRQGEPAFEHHAELPQTELDAAVATVIVGDFAGEVSLARRDTDHVGVDLTFRPGRAALPLRPAHEYALIVLAGALSVGTTVVEPGNLAYLGAGRDDLVLSAQVGTRALLLGGVPFPEPILMWWNFVARTRDEMRAAYEQWQSGDERLRVNSTLPRIDAPPPP
jgi:redox-sensitive bicupin YhaK (pirin superfamily)